MKKNPTKIHYETTVMLHTSLITDHRYKTNQPRENTHKKAIDIFYISTIIHHRYETNNPH